MDQISTRNLVQNEAPGDIRQQAVICTPRWLSWEISDDVASKRLRGFTKDLRVGILLFRWGWKCAYCRCDLTLSTAELEHVIPETTGGPTGYHNLVPACGRCNRRKGSMDPTAFISEVLGWSVFRIAGWIRRSLWIDDVREIHAKFPSDPTGLEFDEAEMSEEYPDLKELPVVPSKFTIDEVIRAMVLDQRRGGC